MITLQVRFNVSEAFRGFDVVDAAGQRAAARALRRTAMNVRTLMVSEVRKDIGLPAGVVRDEVRIKVDPAALVATVGVTGRPIPLIAFSASGPVPSRGRGLGVSYRIGREGRKRISNAFIARVHGPLPSGVVSPGHTGVFVRARAAMTRKSRGAWGMNLPIKQLYGPSLPKVFAKYVPLGEQRAREQFPKNLEHEMRFALSSGR